jgi:uncharacterized phage protein (TIGR01671 family)
MNRTIKFRAWDVKQGKMEHWDSINQLYDNIFWDMIKREFMPLMQFTGLKDKNGIEIYEGDILKDHGIVAWNDVELCWSRIDLNWNDRREWHELDSLTSPMEIIGNIYENPELLK